MHGEDLAPLIECRQINKDDVREAPCRVCSAARPRTSLAVPITKTSDCSCIQLSKYAMVRAVSPPSVRDEDSRPPTAFSNSLMPRMPLRAVAIERARLIVIADEPITPHALPGFDRRWRDQPHRMQKRPQLGVEATCRPFARNSL
jgi:hypothetical protein